MDGNDELADQPPDETIEVDAERFITLEFARRWPTYVVTWSVRQRAGESDFPLADGAVDRLPGNDADPGEMWAGLREAALTQAIAAAATAIAGRGKHARRQSLLDRLLGRGRPSGG